jgi:hypothetical protein
VNDDDETALVAVLGGGLLATVVGFWAVTGQWLLW